MADAPFDPSFPTDALTPNLQGAAEFIRKTNQTPPEMCACSVLAVASLLCQGLVDVRSRDNTQSVTSLVIFVEAESGERKTSNDKIAFEEIHRFERQSRALAKQDKEAYEIQVEIWRTGVKQLKKKLVKLGANGQDIQSAQSELQAMLESQPRQKMRAQMLLTNTTPQALAWHLANVYPYAGLISDEGAAVTESDALSDLGMLNTLTEGGNWSSDRITRQRVEIEHARLMLYLQIQPEMFRDFLRRRGKQVHGSGFSSRWLFVRAKSNQGTRLQQFVDIPSSLIDVYHERVRELLLEYQGPSIPARTVLKLMPAATELLTWFRRTVEEELAEGGRFSLMRGQAAKAAERCAILAAIMHKFEGRDGPISVDVMKGAVRLVSWFLNQHRMRFAAHSQLEIDAIDLEECITRNIHRWEKRRSVDGPELCRYAPRRMRQRDDLHAVLNVLEAQGKVQQWDGPGLAWGVSLIYWFPQTPPEPWPTVATTLGRKFSGGWGRTAAKVLNNLSAPVDACVLWPGVHLPESGH
jgi:hypothetical protein